jgi:hypothetical protein
LLASTLPCLCRAPQQLEDGPLRGAILADGFADEIRIGERAGSVVGWMLAIRLSASAWLSEPRETWPAYALRIDATARSRAASERAKAVTGNPEFANTWRHAETHRAEPHDGDPPNVSWRHVIEIRTRPTTRSDAKT